MDDLKDLPTAAPAEPANAIRPRRRRWLSVLLYLLAGCGVLALALIGLAVYQHSTAEKAPPRVAIDEAAVIENVMGQTYGKYSAAKKGWVYVGDDDRTYVMQVVQQVKLADGADGDELYFIASGTAQNGDHSALYGAFHVHPTRPYDGGLTHVGAQFNYVSTQAVRPEQVHFEALSENLWGWVVKTRVITDLHAGTVSTNNTVLAPHEDRIAVLAEFLSARDTDPGMPCDEAKEAWDIWNGTTTPDTEGVDVEEPEEPIRCDKRRWTYRTGTVSGNIPVPITVTAGGTQDGKPVEPRTWKLMFDAKRFSYNVPDELASED